jgi:hypothetical protein
MHAEMKHGVKVGNASSWMLILLGNSQTRHESRKNCKYRDYTGTYAERLKAFHMPEAKHLMRPMRIGM